MRACVVGVREKLRMYAQPIFTQSSRSCVFVLHTYCICLLEQGYSWTSITMEPKDDFHISWCKCWTEQITMIKWTWIKRPRFWPRSTLKLWIFCLFLVANTVLVSWGQHSALIASPNFIFPGSHPALNKSGQTSIRERERIERERER